MSETWRRFSCGLLLSWTLASAGWSQQDYDTVGADPHKKEEVSHDDSFLAGPFSDYGEFDRDNEDADERFFQHGRFFGVGIGMGLTSATGNAGQLYQGGFPTIDFRLMYWFDFLVALQLVARNSTHRYQVSPDGVTQTNLFRVLAQVKYYFDVKDMAAPISFINPHLIFGAGTYRRTDNFTQLKQSESSQVLGVNGGIGFELTIKPKKFYLQLEFIGHSVTFKDTYDTKYIDFDPKFGLRDRTGLWFDSVASLVWTW